MAVTNTSERAQTIKDMYNLLPSDAWSIDKALYYCVYENASVVQLKLLLDTYYSYFSQYLVEVNVDEKYFYCPQMFAKDYYGDAGLDFLVLYFAKMTTNFDFTKKKIKILDYAKLKEINQLFTKYKTQIENSKSNPPAYSYNDIQDKNTSASYLIK